MGIECKTYTKSEFLSAIESANNKKLDYFSIRYPTDSRCRFSLRVNYRFEDGSCDYSWHEAEDPKVVGNLLCLDVIEAQWNRFNEEKYLSISYRTKQEA